MAQEVFPAYMVRKPRAKPYYRRVEIDTYFIECQCGLVVIVTAENTKDDPVGCPECRTTYWVEGYQVGSVMGERCQP